MTQQWKLVPVEPTPKMIKAWHDAYSKAIIKTGRSARAYAAMLAAAPTPPASAQDDAKDERQAFEAWAKKKKMPLARIGEQYDDFWVDHAWNGWQARASVAAPAAGDARTALAKVESLQRYGFGYADDGNGGRYLSSLKRDDGAFLCRDEVLAAIAAQQSEGGAA
ncbi:hypothetical protein [Achromobacter insolitus]|uniref:hypothetical protein n=1 Tax=Achromobacter insolitus TaxID=217204 RepID=UPI002FE4287C